MEKSRADPLFDLFYWRKIAAVLTLNALITLIVISILLGGGFVKGSLIDTISKFQEEVTVITYTKIGDKTRTKTEKMPVSHLFKPVGEFFDISVKQPVRSKLFNNLIIGVFVEEIVYRAPIRLLIEFFVLCGVERNRLLKLAVWTTGLCLNFHWAISIHTGIETFLWIPVFFAGAGWLWLVIRTNRLWPAMFCHTTANLSIYFAVKVYQFLY